MIRKIQSLFFGRKLQWFLYSVGALPTLFASQAICADIVVTGVLNYKVYRPDQKLLFSSEAQFTCRTAHGPEMDWNIRLEGPQSDTTGPFRAIEYYEVGSRGTNTYRITKARANAFESASRNANSSGRMRVAKPILVSGRVRQGPVPASEPGYYASPIWMAYASSKHLAGKAPWSNVEPVWPIPDGVYDSGSYLVRAAIRLSAATPHLPEEVIFLSDGKYPEKSSGNGRVELKDYHQPFNAGFTNAVFRAGPFTNVHGASIPLEFSLEQWGPKPGGKSAAEIQLRARWDGRLVSVRQAPSLEDYRPEIGGEKALISSDAFRLSNGIPVQFTVTNGLWEYPPKAAVGRMLREASAHLATTRKVKQQNRTVTRMAVLTLFAATSAALGWLAYVIKRRGSIEMREREKQKGTT